MILLVFAFPVAWLLRNTFPVQAALSRDSIYPVGIDSQRVIDGYATENETMAAGDPFVLQKFSVQATGAIPLNLAEDSNGHIWFTSASSDVTGFLIGELDPTARQITVRKFLMPFHALYELAVDASNRVWYVTSYTDPSGLTPDVLGMYDRTSNEFHEWSSDQFLGLYGLKVNPINGDLWFVGTEPPMIFRFQASTSTLIGWPITGYVWAYDLSLDSNGNVWVTDIPWLGGEVSNSTILRLNPSTSVLTQWTLTSLDLAPFKVSAANPGEVWFSEYQSITNSLARLVLATNTYEQYDIPNPASYPGSLSLQPGELWFNAPGIYSLGKLDLPAVPDAQTNLTPVDKNLTSSNPAVTMAVYDHTEFISEQTTIPFSNPQLVSGNQVNNFSLYALPSPGNCNPPEGPWAHGIISSTAQAHWFAGCNYLGFFQQADKNKIYLPLLMKH